MKNFLFIYPVLWMEKFYASFCQRALIHPSRLQLDRETKAFFLYFFHLAPPWTTMKTYLNKIYKFGTRGARILSESFVCITFLKRTMSIFITFHKYYSVKQIFT